MKCDNCAREIEGEVITVSTDKGEFHFDRRCHEERFVTKEGSVSEEYTCKQCGVSFTLENEATVMAHCDGCDTDVPHNQLVHYDGYGVFCQACDKFVEEDLDEEKEQ
jgi:hypothetical protein